MGMMNGGRKLAAMGQHGDTILAHINPHEAMMLKMMGGSGTVNPRTGLMQFFNPEEYLRLYSDVAKDPYFGANPLAHWEKFGQTEGRSSGDIPTGGGEPRPSVGSTGGLLSGGAAPASNSYEAIDYLNRYKDVADDPYWSLHPYEHSQLDSSKGVRSWGVQTGGGEPRPSAGYVPPISQSGQVSQAGTPSGMLGGVQTGGLEPRDPGTAQTFGYSKPVNKYSSGVNLNSLEPNQVDSYWTPPEKWNPATYLAQNVDLEQDPWAKANPLAHYALFGTKEGRQWGTGGYANTNFKNAGAIYLAQNEDVKKAGVDPWEHYLKTGKTEGRKWYGDEWDDQAHLLYSDKDFTAPKEWNAQYYLRDNPDLAGNAWAQANPLAHMALFGQKEGRTYYNVDDLSKVYGPAQKAIVPTEVGGTSQFLAQTQGNYSKYLNNIDDGGNEGLLAPLTERYTVVAQNEGSFNPVDEKGNLKYAKNATRDSISGENVAAIVSLGGSGGLNSYRVYYKDGTFSDLDSGYLERGFIGKTRVESPDGPFYRLIKSDGTTVDIPLENKPSGMARFMSNAGEWINSAMPVIIPAASLAAISAGAGGVIGGAIGGAMGGSAAGAAAGGMTTGVEGGALAGATVAGGSAGTGAAGGTLAGGAAGTVAGGTGGTAAAAATPWYLSQPVLQAATTGVLSTGTGMMQGKPFGAALTQGVIAGALSYAGGYIVDGMGQTVAAAANNPAATKAIVTGILATGAGKLQGQGWEEALTNGLVTGTLSYVGGKLSGWFTGPNGEPVDAGEFQQGSPTGAGQSQYMLSQNPLSGIGEGLTYANSTPSNTPSSVLSYGGYPYGGGSLGSLSNSLEFGSGGYQSPLANSSYFGTEEPFANMRNLYYQNNMPENFPAMLTEGLQFATQTSEVPPFEYGGGNLGLGSLSANLEFGQQPYVSPLKGTIFEEGSGLLQGYPGIQSWGAGAPFGINPFGNPSKTGLPEILKLGAAGLQGLGGATKKSGTGEGGSPKGGLLSLDEMPIPEYMKKKLKRKAMAAGKTWQEYLADATRGQKSYYGAYLA